MNRFNLSNGIHHIPMSLPWSSPGFVNIYLIEDKNGYVMIDCGVEGKEYYQLLIEQLSNLKINIQDISLLIGTHMHSDHIGLSTRIREQGVKFALYKNSKDFINHYNDWKIRFRELIVLAEKQGAPKSFIKDLNEIDTPIYAGKITEPDLLLEEGAVPEVDRKLYTLFTPGHDITEISIHDSSSKVIFSGDHILPKITPFIPTTNEDDDMLGKYGESLDKVYNINHSIIAPGHGGLITSPYERIEQMKLHHQRRTEKILEILKASKKSGWEILEELFPRNLDPLNLRLAFQETMAHILYLKKNNKINFDLVNSVQIWEKLS